MADKDSLKLRRARHDKENPYFMMRRDTAQDSRLSYDARGLLAYLLSQKDDWVVIIKDLINQSPDGKHKVYRILAELLKHRYLKREKIRDPKTGRFVVGNYEVFEMPYEDVAPHPHKPHPDFPDVGNPDTEKQPLEIIEDKKGLDSSESTSNVNTESKKEKKKKNTTDVDKQRPAPKASSSKAEKKTPEAAKTEQSAADDKANAETPQAAPAATPFAAMKSALLTLLGWREEDIAKRKHGQIGKFVNDLLSEGLKPEELTALWGYVPEYQRKAKNFYALLTYLPEYRAAVRNGTHASAEPKPAEHWVVLPKNPPPPPLPDSGVPATPEQKAQALAMMAELANSRSA